MSRLSFRGRGSPSLQTVYGFSSASKRASRTRYDRASKVCARRPAAAESRGGAGEEGAAWADRYDRAPAVEASHRYTRPLRCCACAW
eukprot:2034050-Pleurochrysis_carterae.AAC.2